MKRNFSIKGQILNRKGFTLIELIVVMAVIAIISAIALPKYLGIQDKAEEDADRSTGILIAKAAELYIAAEKVTDTFTVGDLIEVDYYDPIEFQSDDFESVTADSLNITHDGNKVTSIKTSDAIPKILYTKE